MTEARLFARCLDREDCFFYDLDKNGRKRKYGFSAELERLCEAWVTAWTEHFDEFKLGQELDPITGVPSPSSEWYSSTMLFYIYAVEKFKNNRSFIC